MDAGKSIKKKKSYLPCRTSLPGADPTGYTPKVSLMFGGIWV